MNSGDGARTEPAIASACLLGVRCRYDGTSRARPELLARLRGGRGVSAAHEGQVPSNGSYRSWSVIPVCPEQLGGLPTPRPPCRLEWSRTGDAAGDATGDATGEDVLERRAVVVDDLGVDRTAEFLRGAEETLRIARSLGAGTAFLKAGSPSCDAGSGVTAARLRRAGVDIVGVR